MTTETDPNVLARTCAPSSSSSSSLSPTHPTSGVSGVGGGLIEALCSRGVVPANAQALVERFDAERIGRAVAYFDALADGGPGLLVKAVREGREPQRSRRDVVAEQAAYADSIRGWLTANFPDLCDPSPHPGAVAAVIRLHYRDGKGRLTRARHGAEIREFAAAWERRLGVAA